jgi:hypothetical protein
MPALSPEEKQSLQRLIDHDNLVQERLHEQFPSIVPGRARVAISLAEGGEVDWAIRHAGENLSEHEKYRLQLTIAETEHELGNREAAKERCAGLWSAFWEMEGANDEEEHDGYEVTWKMESFLRLWRLCLNLDVETDDQQVRSVLFGENLDHHLNVWLLLHIMRTCYEADRADWAAEAMDRAAPFSLGHSRGAVILAMVRAMLRSGNKEHVWMLLGAMGERHCRKMATWALIQVAVEEGMVGLAHRLAAMEYDRSDEFTRLIVKAVMARHGEFDVEEWYDRLIIAKDYLPHRLDAVAFVQTVAEAGEERHFPFLREKALELKDRFQDCHNEELLAKETESLWRTFLFIGDHVETVEIFNEHGKAKWLKRQLLEPVVRHGMEAWIPLLQKQAASSDPGEEQLLHLHLAILKENEEAIEQQFQDCLENAQNVKATKMMLSALIHFVRLNRRNLDWLWRIWEVARGISPFFWLLRQYIADEYVKSGDLQGLAVAVEKLWENDDHELDIYSLISRCLRQRHPDLKPKEFPDLMGGISW